MEHQFNTKTKSSDDTSLANIILHSYISTFFLTTSRSEDNQSEDK